MHYRFYTKLLNTITVIHLTELGGLFADIPLDCVLD